ncbi:SDR family oxidoreductase [Aspergillus stella-maris]|uniref:SDR family oxidoreductase n=1 Tax=Aspergillus stella-maris TaxID=1810926 RepID=UPI003CCE2A55
MATNSDKRQSVLITGCASGGIGNALALEFHKHDLRVFATARDAKSLEDLASLGIETLSLTVDDEDSVQLCFAEVERRLEDKGLDYLVNNAGRNYTVPATEVDLSEVRTTFEVNFFAVVYMCKAFTPLLIRSKGTIVQIGSVAGTIPYVFGSIYNASKAALHSYSDTLRVELAPFGVNVTTVVTGGVQSRIARTKRTLAPNSIYAPIEDQYMRRVTHSQDGAMSHDAYARSVVSQVLYGSAPWRWIWPWARGRKSWIWEGNKSWVIWFFLGGWAWTGLAHAAMIRMFGLNRLRKAIGN